MRSFSRGIKGVSLRIGGFRSFRTILSPFFFTLSIFALPCLAGAADLGLERELQKSLEDNRAVVKKAKEKIKKGAPADDEATHLKTKAKNIKASHQSLLEKFRHRGEEVSLLGGKAIERHRAMEEGYKKAMEEYLGLIDGLPPGQVTQADIDNLETYLDKMVHKRRIPILGVLPYRNLSYPSKEPAQSPAIKPAYKGGNKIVAPEDTKSTEEAPISTEIANLAQSLNWSPVPIYEYVKNNIETDWYRGCMKGAEETLRQKSGNDCDQATLLIALLRASGFPSRYVRGTIEFFAGGKNVIIDKVKNLTGIDDPWKIAEFFQKAGIPYKPVISGGGISNFQIEHIWVESFIPYGNYRGAIIDDSYKMWLGLDTSIKVKGYTYNNPIDIFQQSAVSGQLPAMRDEYLGAVQTLTPLGYLEAKLTAAGYQLSDFPSTRTIIPENMKILPASTQFTLIKATHEYTEIPDELKHKVRFVATDTNNSGLLDFELSTLSLSNKKITMSYEPETVEDQEIINAYGGLDNTPAYLVRLRPVLKVDGERVTVSTDGLPMGMDCNLTIELITPNGTEKVTGTHITGNLTAIGITAQRAISQELSAISEEDDAETILFKEVNSYIDRWNKAEEDLASLFHLTMARPIPTVANLGGVIDVTYLLDMPHGFEWKGVFLDANLRAIETAISHQQSAISQVDRQKTFMQLSALQGSVLEHRAFEDDLQVDSISSAKLFGIAGNTQPATEILTIDRTNVDAILPALSFDDEIKQDITNAVNQNLSIRIPQAEIVYKDWTGIGYIKENLETGEAGYMLSGMIAGGMTAEEWADWYLQSLAEKLGNSYTGEYNEDPFSAAKIIKILVTDQKYAIVGKELEQPLAVLVTDSNDKPVKGASVTFRVIAGGGKINGADNFTTTTAQNGIAKAPLTLSTKTEDNPDYRRINSVDEFVTQVGVNLVTAAVKSSAGEIRINQPFEAFGKPDEPKEIVKVFGDKNLGMVNNPGGSLAAKIIDQFGNPISNLNLVFETVQTESRYPDIPLPPGYRTLQFYKSSECGRPYPLFEECSTAAQMKVKSEYFGVIVGTILGNTVGTKYIIETKNVETDILPVFFDLYTSGFRNKDDYIPPGVYLKYLIPENDKGEPVNASKAGTELKAPLTSELFMLYDEYALEPSTCYRDGTPWSCCKLKARGIVNITPITDGSVTYSSVQGGGSVVETKNLGNGKYQARYMTGVQPMENRIEALGEATILVPKVLLDPLMTKCAAQIQTPSFSGEPDTAYYKPECKTAQTEYSLADLGGTCEFPRTPFSLKSGQQVGFWTLLPPRDPSEEPTIIGSEQKAKYTVYGVLPEITATQPQAIFLDNDGYTISDILVNYSIKPAEYNAIIADMDIFEREPGSTNPANDKGMYLFSGKITQGDGFVTIFRGTQFNPDKEYYAQAVLNRGSDAEIRGEKVPLPIGQFKIVAYDEPEKEMVGAVTDGAAKLRLQLIVKGDKKAFQDGVWRIVDPQLSGANYSTSGRGTLLDAEDNPTEAVLVTFNADGISEVVYQAPDTFVRWGTAEEAADKELAERYIQPTIDLARYLSTHKDPMPQLRLKRPPVVLVHGLWGNESAWDVFEPKFNDRGLYAVHRVDYSVPGNVLSIADPFVELKFQKAIDKAIGKSRKDLVAVNKIDIVAHSMGGLVTRQFCFDNKTDCQERLRRVVTIATPHFGSELADLLIIYRDTPTYDFPTSLFPEVCRAIIDTFVSGFNYKLPYIGINLKLPPSPIYPRGGAIDNLATGVLLPDFQRKAAIGQWADLPPLSNALSAHAIIGLTNRNTALLGAYDPSLIGLWNLILPPCGIKRDILFGAEADLNDRVVKQSSQQGGVGAENRTSIEQTDHFTVRNSDIAIERIKRLFDDPANSTSLTR